MAKSFLTSIDLNKNQILNVALQNLATAPSNPVSGQIYYNTTDRVIYYWKVTNSPNPGNGEWVNISGDITEVIAGSGLTGGGSGGVVTLDLNPDNSTIEVNNDIVRIKDLGVTNQKLADDAVTTIKILNKNITFSKIQDIATMTVIGRVASGTGVASEIGIIDNLSGATTTTLATSQAIKLYVDSAIAAIGNLEGGWNASSGTFPVGSSPTSGTIKGDYWYVTTAGTVDGVLFNVGDVIVAKVNGASTTSASDWIQLEVNRDQATTTILGLVRLATNAETQTGTDTEKAITPSALSSRTATESRTGIAELATQIETDTGTDDERIVTPLKLKTLLDNRVGGFTTNIGDNTNTSFVVTHNLNTKNIVVSIYDNSTEEEVITDVLTTTVNTITVSFAIIPTTNKYRVVIKK
jgi:hypothetical protein